jgi:hypothetical protein
MILAILFGAVLNTLVQGHTHFDDCLQDNFESKSCWNSEQMFKAGKFLCKVQGKPYSGKSDCSVAESEK